MNKNWLRFALSCLCFALAGGAELQAQSNKGSISGNVFNDTDGDAKSEQGEGRAAGQKVKLYRILDDGTRELVGEVITDAQGNYNFASLDLGTYTLIFEFTSGVKVETATVITLAAETPSYVQQPVPFLDTNYRETYGRLALSSSPTPGSQAGTGTLEALGFRNPANLTGQEVSRFVP